jgi:hypothetical protein
VISKIVPNQLKTQYGIETSYIEFLMLLFEKIKEEKEQKTQFKIF